MENEKELFKARDLRLAAIRYFDAEANGIELTEALGYVILENIRENLYVNVFDIADSTPIFERVPYSNTTLDGEDYGTKVRSVLYEAETGPCYLLTKIKLSDCFDKDLISRKDLEDYILNSDYYFRNRKEIVMKNLKKHPFRMLKTLYEDTKSEERFVDFFEQRDYVVFKK